MAIEWHFFQNGALGSKNAVRIYLSSSRVMRKTHDHPQRTNRLFHVRPERTLLNGTQRELNLFNKSLSSVGVLIPSRVYYPNWCVCVCVNCILRFCFLLPDEIEFWITLPLRETCLSRVKPRYLKYRAVSSFTHVREILRLTAVNMDVLI